MNACLRTVIDRTSPARCVSKPDSRVIIDSTVQDKAIAYPTGYIRLLEIARRELEDHMATTPIRTLLEQAERMRYQSMKAKDKLYALHAPQLECITLAEQLEQTEILSRRRTNTIIVDLGNRGRHIEGVEILHRGEPKRLTERQWLWVQRRQAIEPVVGDLKDDCGLRRNHTKGSSFGDALKVIACAAAYNLRWLLRWIVLLCRSIYRLINALVASLDPEIRIQWMRVRLFQ